MNALRTKILGWLTVRRRTLLLHDLVVFFGALFATGVLDSDHLTRAVLISALITAVKVTVRTVLPAPPAQGTAMPVLLGSTYNLTAPASALATTMTATFGTPAPLVHDPAVHLTGKAPVKNDRRTLRLEKYLDTSQIPPAPASTDRASKVKTWSMLGNDTLGDCTCAAAGHMVKLWTALAGKMARITTKEVVALYSAVTGYTPSDPNTDRGAVELDVLNYWRKTGLAGHRIAAFVKIALKSHDQVRAAVWLFDGAYIGLQLPVSAQRQEVWDVTIGSDAKAGSWGGHAVDIVDYNETGPVVVTWGALKQMTWAFWDAYCDEAYALLSLEDIVPATGQTIEGFDVIQLQADLKAVAA